jgi:hypothetical protein
MIDEKMVKESLTKDASLKVGKEEKEKKVTKKLPYVKASVHIGRERLGGAIFEVDLDVTHPLGFGYRS